MIIQIIIFFIHFTVIFWHNIQLLTILENIVTVIKSSCPPPQI